MDRLGRHIIVEFYGCPDHRLNDVMHIETSFIEAAQKAEATVINSSFHHFSPFGVSGVVVIQESHLAIHTWPEFGYAAIDIFTCGDTVDPWICYDYLYDRLGAEHGSAMEMNRGQVSILAKSSPEVATANSKVTTHDPFQPAPKPSLPRTMRNVWFTERDENVAFSLRHTGEHYFKATSPYQTIEVLDTFQYGKLLTLDGKVMTTERDEYVYHEMMTHVASLTHPRPQRALVIGGGDGGAVRELLRHNSYLQIVMVEIDALVIEACKKFFPTIAEALNHPSDRLEVLIEDGIEYINNSPSSSFDVIIIDSTDPIGPAKGLFTESFYREVYRCLTPDGIMIVQSESPRFNTEVFQEIYGCFYSIFGQEKVFPYLLSIPTYPSGTWSAAYCSKGKAHPLEKVDFTRIEKFSQRHKLQYYNADVHKAAFALPNYVRNLLKAAAESVNPEGTAA